MRIMDRNDWLDSSVPLPPGLTLAAVRRSIEYIERELAELVEIYYEQMNVFSAIVGIFGTKALDSGSSYGNIGMLTPPSNAFLTCNDGVPAQTPLPTTH